MCSLISDLPILLPFSALPAWLSCLLPAELFCGIKKGHHPDTPHYTVLSAMRQSIMHKNAFSRIFILYNVRVLCFCVIINAYNTDIDISDSQSCHIFNCCLDFFLYLGRYFHNILSKP